MGDKQSNERGQKTALQNRSSLTGCVLTLRFAPNWFPADRLCNSAYLIAKPGEVQDERCLFLRKRFAARVRELRLELGLSQEALAEKCSVHRVYMGRIERAKVSPSLCFVDRIAKALNTSVSGLLDGIDV